MVEHHWAGGVRGWERQRFRHFCRAHPISECCSPARRLPSSGTARAPWALGAGFGGFGGLPTSTPSAQPHQRLQLSPASVRATSAAPKRSRDRDLTGLAPSDPSNQRTACGFEGHCSIPLNAAAVPKKSPLYTTHGAGLRSLPLYSACALPRWRGRQQRGTASPVTERLSPSRSESARLRSRSSAVGLMRPCPGGSRRPPPLMRRCCSRRHRP